LGEAGWWSSNHCTSVVRGITRFSLAHHRGGEWSRRGAAASRRPAGHQADVDPRPGGTDELRFARRVALRARGSWRLVGSIGGGGGRLYFGGLVARGGGPKGAGGERIEPHSPASRRQIACPRFARTIRGPVPSVLTAGGRQIACPRFARTIRGFGGLGTFFTRLRSCVLGAAAGGPLRA
jgi:hypothetical protein